ncbi:hypothetical protein PCYB_131540 [Plasmodium cynomolgi strain B]|uniref:Uncharacterized protein n=1 Tax=Plasmodium cynomolgi (strain B) TaxID=1120755 RepID=K6UX25_PLACD|nr:hypothetical protein PCYB_131540 [Plasmodium cynomolgi strain B]GAB68279.1 hypothetical protein PCYB_131540 [Plasmodium cynomolgi strain B]
MQEEQKHIVEVNAIKGYYKKTFTNELLLSLQKEINIEDLLYSYNYYSNFLTEDDKFDNEEVGSEYLKSEDELEELPPSGGDKKYKVRKGDSDEDMINYFDPTVSEELYEEKIEQTFEYLDNFLKAFYVPNDMNDSGEMEIINDVVKNLVIEKINDDEYKILDMQCEKSQIYEITLIIIAYIIRNIFSLKCANINSQQICNIFQTKKKKKNMTQENAEQDGGTSDQGEKEETHTGGDVPPATTDTDDADVNLENFTYDSEYEEEECTYDDISFVSKNLVEEEMKKHNVQLSQICKMIKINVYKYLYMIYKKDDLLLKINVLEIFSKFVQNEYYSNSTVENCYFLHTVLKDLHKSDDEVLPLSILNSLICYSKINSALLHFIISTHDNILMKTIISYLTNDSTHGSSSNVEKLIVGIKSFGYFFSLKESSQALLSLNSNAHLIVINNINTHSHTNVLKHAINIWVKILPAECMGAEWNKQLVHDVLFQKVITILKEIDDTEVQINAYQVLRFMVPYSIADFIIQEQWLIRTLKSSFGNNSYELKMNRYNFFKELYELNKITITNDAFADNLISNFLEKVPKRY